MKVGVNPSSLTCETNVSTRRSDYPATYTVDEAIEKLGFGPFQLLLFLLSGLTWFATSAELMILTVLSPAVKCQWSLSKDEEAIITSITFIGSVFGSIFWGIMGDNFGRKKTIFAINLVTLIFGVLSALQLTPDDARIPGYPWMLFCRFGIGFGVGGAPQASTYFIEFIQLKKRAICSVAVLIWVAIGAIFVAALAVGVMGPNKLGWHWYLGLTAIPLLIVLVLIPFMPESARFQVTRGRKKEAIQVLRWVAWLNFTSLPPGELLMPEDEDNGNIEGCIESKSSDSNDCGAEKYSLTNTLMKSLPADVDGQTKSPREREPLLSNVKTQIQPKNLTLRKYVLLNRVAKLPLLFSNGMWKTTIPLYCLWYGSSWLYYGSVLLPATMLLVNPHCEGNVSEISMFNLSYAPNSGYDYDRNISNATSCKDSELDTADYLLILYAAAAPLPCTLVTIVIVEILGRKLTVIVNLVITMLGFCLLFICTTKTLLTFFFSIIQGFSFVTLLTLCIYTLEVYPTDIRGVGIGFSYAISRIGGITTPYVAQVLFQTSDYATISLYAGSCLVFVLLVLLLTIETRGKSLK